jgi:hypothetical protein
MRMRRFDVTCDEAFEKWWRDEKREFRWPESDEDAFRAGWQARAECDSALVQIATDAIEDVENLRTNDRDLVTKFPGTYCTEQTFEAHVDEAFRRVLIHLEDLRAALASIARQEDKP